jgi:DivIVA domain-containing protein
MANSHTSDSSPQRVRRGTPASERLRDVSFPMAVRGYDRRAVDEFIDELRTLIADLEAHQTREGVVQKALDELGEETASILQRAHETADEIAGRSRAQADGRLQRAEREAEIVKRDADEYAEQVVVDTRLLWDERQRLIDDIRHLADEVLATADDAIERLKLPEPLAADEQESEPTTSEAPVRPIPHPLSIARDPQPELEDDPSVPYDLETPEDDDTGAPAQWAVAARDEQDPDTAAAWGVEDEEDPDATALWAVEREEGQHATAPWAVEEAEEDPDATAPWAVEGEDPNATAPWAGEAADGEDSGGASRRDTREESDEGEEADYHTVELEALPGRNPDEQPTDPEHERD